MDHGSDWQIQCFCWPQDALCPRSTLLSSPASVIHRMLWGQTSEDGWTPGDWRTSDMWGCLRSQLRWHYSLFSPLKLSFRQGHRCLAIFSQKPWKDPLHSRRFRFPQTFENKHSRQEQCCSYRIMKIKKAKITIKSRAVKPFWSNPTLVQIPADLICAILLSIL